MTIVTETGERKSNTFEINYTKGLVVTGYKKGTPDLIISECNMNVTPKYTEKFLNVLAKSKFTLKNTTRTKSFGERVVGSKVCGHITTSITIWIRDNNKNGLDGFISELRHNNLDWLSDLIEKKWVPKGVDAIAVKGQFLPPD